MKVNRELIEAAREGNMDPSLVSALADRLADAEDDLQSAERNLDRMKAATSRTSLLDL